MTLLHWDLDEDQFARLIGPVVTDTAAAYDLYRAAVEERTEWLRENEDGWRYDDDGEPYQFDVEATMLEECEAVATWDRTINYVWDRLTDAEAGEVVERLVDMLVEEVRATLGYFDMIVRRHPELADAFSRVKTQVVDEAMKALDHVG